MPDLILYPTQSPLRIPQGGGGGASAPQLEVVSAAADASVAYGQLMEADASAGHIDISLPSAASVAANGNMVVVKNSGTANTVGLSPQAGDSIDDGTTALDPGQWVVLVSDGASTFIVVSDIVVTYDQATNTFTFWSAAGTVSFKIAGHDVVVVDAGSTTVQDPSGSAFVFFNNAIARIAYGNNILQCDGQGIRVFNAVFVTANYTTGGRPSAVNAGSGAQIYDTTLSKPIWSDGAVWRDAAGNAV